MDINKTHPPFGSTATTIRHFHEFPQPHSNNWQLHVSKELMNALSLTKKKNDTRTATHLAYHELALDNFFGTDPDQVAELFLQLMKP